VAGVERVVCLELAQAWLQAALADTEQNKHLQSEQRANKMAGVEEPAPHATDITTAVKLPNNQLATSKAIKHSICAPRL
jgi:hypothetical protein